MPADPVAANKLGRGVSRTGRDRADSRSARASSGIGTDALPGPVAPASKDSAADPVAAPVDQERIDAARARIKRTVEYLDSISADSPYEKFASQRLDLRQALDLLDPEVKLA